MLQPRFTFNPLGWMLFLVLATCATLCGPARASSIAGADAVAATCLADVGPGDADAGGIANCHTPTRMTKELRRPARGQANRTARLRSRESADAQAAKAPPQASLPMGSVCIRLWRAINTPTMFRGYSLASIKGKLVMLLRCAANFRALRRWHSLSLDPTFSGMIERHPLLPALHARPYINSAWSLQERRQVLQTHYTMIHEGGAASILDFPSTQSVLLVSLDEIEPGVQLTLDKPRWLADEGEVAINLFKGNTRIYSLMFTIGERNGRRIAYVGAIQGKAGGNGLEENRRLTRAAHAMRPRDLLFAAFRMLCKHVQVDAILAIADAGNICHSAYFNGRKRMYVQHDPAWQEYGGVIRPDGFFEIGVPVAYRDAKDVPARKRALYRRRYEMLHGIDAAIAERVKERSLNAA